MGPILASPFVLKWMDFISNDQLASTNVLIRAGGHTPQTASELTSRSAALGEAAIAAFGRNWTSNVSGKDCYSRARSDPAICIAGPPHSNHQRHPLHTIRPLYILHSRELGRIYNFQTGCGSGVKPYGNNEYFPVDQVQEPAVPYS